MTPTILDEPTFSSSSYENRILIYQHNFSKLGQLRCICCDITFKSFKNSEFYHRNRDQWNLTMLQSVCIGWKWILCIFRCGKQNNDKQKSKWTILLHKHIFISISVPNKHSLFLLHTLHIKLEALKHWTTWMKFIRADCKYKMCIFLTVFFLGKQCNNVQYDVMEKGGWLMVDVFNFHISGKIFAFILLISFKFFFLLFFPFSRLIVWFYMRVV